MSETESAQTGRVRRRAGRPAGPPVDEAKAEAKASTPAAAGGDSATQQTVGDSGAKSAAAATDEVTVKTATTAPVAEDKTEKLAPPADAAATDDATVKLATPGADDETVKLATADAAAGDEPGRRTLGVLGWAAVVVAVLSALVLLGSGGFYAYHQHSVDALAAQRDDYVQTAKQAVLNLTNIKDDSAQQDIDRVLSVASGQLKEEYSARKDDYAKVVQQAKVKASGEIIESALESSDDHTARVLVAAKQTLTNAGSPDPQQRYYRFRITLTRDGGHTTASQVEFVA
ncbi:hypothetical protein [Nocardia spumae]|uniref:hypothetical protein n=1 Tax=Nocardia spumae TaxID=2887190 RepID=UPI001D14A158|nr:hypothetical protein [Nocardia spumae]